MTTQKAITFANKDSAEAVELLGLALEQGDFEHLRITQYSMALEEALLVWREEFPENAQVSVRKETHKARTELFVEVKGDKQDPLNREDEGDDYANLRKRILAGCGVEFRYFYKNGTNILRLRFPHKKSEQRIFSWNYMAIGIPIVLQLMLMAAINATDGFMLGFLSQNSLAAVSLTNSYAAIFTMAMSAVTIGLSILVAQFWGKADRESVNDVLILAMRFALGVAMLFFAGACFFPGAIMRFYSNEPEIIALGSQYLRVIGTAFLIDAIGQVYACIMINIGHVVKSTVYSIASAILNVILNAILIFGLFGAPKLGVIGAALASLISVLVRTSLYIVEMVKDGFLSDILKGIFTAKSKYKTLFWQQTATVLADRVSWCLSDTVVAAFIGHMGADVVGAKSLCYLVYSIVFTVGAGFGQGVGVLIGNDLGRGNLKLAERKSHWIAKRALAAGIFNFVLMIGLGRLFMLMPMDFTDEATSYCSVIIFIYAINAIFHALNNILNGCTYAGGDSKALMYIDSFCSWIIVVGIGALLVYVIKAPTIVCLAFLLNFETISFPFKYTRLRKSKWVRNLTK